MLLHACHTQQSTLQFHPHSTHAAASTHHTETHKVAWVAKQQATTGWWRWLHAQQSKHQQ
jgi:hypothetical protein